MYYFAYGSNLNRQQMRERCPDSKPAFTASLNHYKLIFAGWSRAWRGGTASIKPQRGEKVLGAIYDVPENDLRRLDKYEGHPETFNRLKVIVNTETGDPVAAFTYIRARQSEETKPAPQYLSLIQQGYRDWGLI